jgi:hypothetical protein
MLGKIISIVVVTFSPMDVKLALIDSIQNPIKANIHSLGAALFDGAIGDAGSTRVVGLDGCSRLGMAKFFKDHSAHDGVLAVVEDGGEFGFCGRGDDDLDDVGVDEDRAIERRGLVVGSRSTSRVDGFLAEEKISAESGT